LNRSKAALEPDHLLFASARDVTVLDEAQFPAYDRAIVYPAGSSSFPEVVADLRMVREEVVHRFPRLAPVGTFLTTEAWNEPDLIVAMRKAIAAGRSVAREIDPSRREQVALTLEAAGVFAIGFAACVGRVFHQYLQPKERATLSDALKVIVWGGRDQYEYIASLRRAIIEAKGPATGDPPELSLPDWDVFLQLVRSHLDVPRFSFRIPQLLRSAAIDVAAGRPFLSRYGSASPMLIKLAMFVASYYAKASLLPPEIVTRIRDLFLRQMSDVASRQTAQRDAVTATQDDSGSGGTETPPPGSSTDWFS
jgi:hypothetical protein